MPSVQYRHVCFTSFEPEPPAYDASRLSYLIYGREVCPNTGRRHYQCYCEFVKRVTLRTLQQMFPRSHFEKRNGSVEQAISYCKKDGAFTEHGTKSSQGARHDLRSIADSISNGTMALHDVARTAPSLFVQYGRGLSFLSSVTSRARTNRWRDVRCNIVWGATGTGKTRDWFERYGDDGYRFQYSGDKSWWDGYYGEKHILFDEFSCQIPLSVMLQWMDGYPCQLWIKGSHTWAAWETFTIISNEDPHMWYSNCPSEKRRAFARRIISCTWYGENNQTDFDERFSFGEMSDFVSNNNL